MLDEKEEATSTYESRVEGEKWMLRMLRTIQVERRSDRWRRGKLYEVDDSLVEEMGRASKERLIELYRQREEYYQKLMEEESKK